jgi:hypothetical protein
VAEKIIIDISQLDAEIQEKKGRIGQLENEIEELIRVKQYLLRTRGNAHFVFPDDEDAPEDLGISGYIQWYLGQKEEDTAEHIAEGWATYSKQKTEDVRTQISNSLNRLKNDLEKIDSRPLGIGRKDGYLWFLRK